MNQDDLQNSFDLSDVSKNKLYAGLGYLIFFIPLLVKNSKFARFHGNQVLILWIAGLINNVAFWVLYGWWMLGYHEEMALLAVTIWTVGNLFIGVTGIINMIGAFRGKAWRVPFLGKLTILRKSNDIEEKSTAKTGRMKYLVNAPQHTSWNQIKMRCPRCGALAGGDKKFCFKCGIKLEVYERCLYCNGEIEAGKRFCANCGKPVQETKEILCFKCGKPVSTMFKFCPECGQNISKAQEHRKKDEASV